MLLEKYAMCNNIFCDAARGFLLCALESHCKIFNMHIRLMENCLYVDNIYFWSVFHRYFPAQQAMQMALGNINLHTMDTLLPEIDPDLLLTRENVSERGDYCSQSVSGVSHTCQLHGFCSRAVLFLTSVYKSLVLCISMHRLYYRQLDVRY